jgi:PAS domain S-box-containing protein
VVILLGIAVAENLFHHFPDMPEPAPLILVCAVVCGFLTTLNSAVLSSLIAVAYALVFVANRHYAHQSSISVLVESIFLAAAAPPLAITGALLRQSANRTANALQKHLANTPLGVIELYADYEVRVWAGSAQTIFGLSSEQAVGKNLFDLPGIFFDEEDGHEIRRLLSTLERGAQTRAVLQTRSETRDGGEAHSRWFWSSTLDAGSRHSRFLVLVEDITERVRAEQELEHSKSEIIERLVRASEHRDEDTGMHVSRMARYCEAVAEMLDLPVGQCKVLRSAAPMHDIGKIGIPDQILLKPGKLTAEEYEIMKGHTTIGAQILSGSSADLVQMAEQIALTHHERWDGTGYPQGLKGEAIPLVGRISAICDVFDALTSQRPYKEAWTVKEALAEIRRSSGTQFDPKVVEAFVAILPRIMAIRAEYEAIEIRNETRAA